MSPFTKKITSGVFIFMLLFTSFTYVPPRAEAQLATIDFANLFQTTWTAFTGNELWIKEYVLDQLAWMLIEQAIQSLTASVVNWINGSNGGGFSLFVQNLPNHLLNVSDSQALNFFAEFDLSESPFAARLLSAVRTTYLYGTSRNGFWAANRSTLPYYSQNPNAFINGDFSQGGWGAWFALTTQPNNNPYLLSYRLKTELGNRINIAVTAQESQLNWGRGFLSWCGDVSSSGGSGDSEIPDSVAITSAQICEKEGGGFGSIQTPGSVIQGQLEKSLGSTFERLNIADELNEIVSALAQRLITTVMGDSGLFGLSAAPIGGGRPLIDQFGTEIYGPPSGTTNTLVTLLDKKQSDILLYQENWETIDNAAQAARSALESLSSCNSSAAQSALTNQVNPVLSQATSAFTLANNALAIVADYRSQLSSNLTSTELNALTQEIQGLQNVRPSGSDMAQALNDSHATGGATASPTGSLNVSGGTIVDRMNLIRDNASRARVSCFLPII